MAHSEAEQTQQPSGAVQCVKRHGQTLFNVYLFVSFGIWVGWQTWQTWLDGRLNYVEIAFAVHSVILVVLLLVRSKHRAVDHSLLHQAVALVAFCSGLFFIGQAPTGGPVTMTVSEITIFAANVLGVVTQLNLGRSFGILIARRQVRTGGLYAVVRHPMYGTDILLRIGFLISHFTWTVVLLFILSTACYVWRAMLEERFLSQEQDYREYMQRVRYRFLPGLF